MENVAKEVIHGLITTGIYYEVCQTAKRQYNFLVSVVESPKRDK